MLRHVDCFISPSHFTKDKHHELGLNIPIRHIPNFAPKSEEQSDAIHDLASRSVNRPYFLFVGRLEKIKGLQNLIPLFRKRTEYDLLVAGDGEYGNVLRKLSENAFNIKFLGRLSTEKIQKLYQGALAVIIPSICYDIFPTVVIESFAMKTPVIVNNLGGLPEVIEDSSGGYIYGNNEELLNAMDHLATDQSLRDRLGHNGYQAYLKYWSSDSHMGQYFNLINELQKKRISNK
jgi:glycosyltransferase involved in cell wall biosynthesis